jgi:hypothetical protein
LENIEAVQDQKMLELSKIYDETEFGQRNHANAIENYEMFKEYIPVSTYESLSPYYNSIFSGEYQLLMAEPPLFWAISRFKSKGYQMNIPMTARDILTRVRAWPRALFSFIRKTGKYDILNGGILNISYPGRVMMIQVGTKKVPAGYTTGIVARFVEEHTDIKLTPPQTDLDMTLQDVSKKSWSRRFEFIVKAAKSTPVNVIRGDVKVLLNFGRFMKSRYRKAPKDLWNVAALICSGTTGIHAKYKLPLRALYGDCTILECYEGSSGFFAQQIDESPFMVPNYDLYFFEVLVNGSPKPLYRMQPGEMGSLIVSSYVLPRFKIGDMIRCMGENRFIVIGREKTLGQFKYNMFTSSSPLATERDIW